MNQDDLNMISANNLSEAWAKAFIECWNTPGLTLTPGIVQFTVDGKHEDIEQENIRELLEKQPYYQSRKPFNHSYIETVAGTIFPQSIWSYSNNDRELFYDLYKKAWPFIKKVKDNRKGVYFYRLINYNNGEDEPVNQLEFIINTWLSGNHRHSALQSSIFDPRYDHQKTRILGFPCLQHVVFHPNGTNGSDGLNIVGFYANQLLLEKAYGNYLGLYRLGEFMAKEMNLKLKKVICISTNLKLSKKMQRNLYADFVEELKTELNL